MPRSKRRRKSRTRTFKRALQMRNSNRRRYRSHSFLDAVTERKADMPIILEKEQLIWQGFGPYGLPHNTKSFVPSKSDFDRHSTRFFSLCEFTALGYARGSYACFQVKRNLALLDASTIRVSAGETEGEQELSDLVDKFGFDGFIRTNEYDDNRGCKYHPLNKKDSPFGGGIEHSTYKNMNSITCPEVYIKSPQTVLDIGPYSEMVKTLFEEYPDWDAFERNLNQIHTQNTHDQNLKTFLQRVPVKKRPISKMPQQYSQSPSEHP